MKWVSKLLLTVASLTLGLASVDVKPTTAAIVNYAFTVDSPTKKGNGLFSFDDATFTDGIAKVQSLTFKFDDESNIYTEQDDFDYPEYPIVFINNFSTGKTSFALDYAFGIQNNPASSIAYEIVGEDFTIYSLDPSNTEFISGTVTYAKVPEPTILGGILLVGTVALMKQKKIKVS
ncbi:PEP-CTERM sorting domain-containing protein [Nostoc sp. CENA543]|uniref:PEP-CTERM sorting domain-containing protein n=1 Tax=Nostoc sp. CENA543 TaxID=1869241 RepID=UPI000CA0DC0F|nr:PEP-CTERM sorting domain-containing protein [Nostoc sp. CENA543]AUS99497.1 PEP-CTERM sorting domain-containing protein [Nostoc sp. CENA543]